MAIGSSDAMLALSDARAKVITAQRYEAKEAL